MAETDKWIEAIVKLKALTQSGQLKWTARDSARSASGEGGPHYFSEHGGKILRLRRAYEREWDQELPRLEFVDAEDRSLWTFPYSEALDDLYQAVRYQTAGVGDFLDTLLEGEQ